MEQVIAWLENLNLLIYADAFERNGWNDLEAIKLMNEGDVKEIVQRSGHVGKIQLAIANLTGNSRLDTTASLKDKVCVQTRLPNSQSQETITDLPVFMANDYYYKNAKTPRMLYFNEVLSDLHDSSNVLPKLVFEEYLFTEREYRWKRKCKLDQLSKELEFIMGENPACLGYYVKRMKKISRSNFSKMKDEVEKLRKMQEILNAEVNDITEENTKLYKQEIIRKGYENQNEYYTRILDRIINEQQKLNEFIEHGENLLKIGTCILPEKTKGKEHINRRKRENKRKVRKQKEKRLFTACEKLLKRLVSQETYIKCCPKIFSFNSQYRIKVEELLTNGLDSIRPRRNWQLSKNSLLLISWKQKQLRS